MCCDVRFVLTESSAVDVVADAGLVLLADVGDGPLDHGVEHGAALVV